MAIVGDGASPGTTRECGDDNLTPPLHVGGEAKQLLRAEVLQALLAAVAANLYVCIAE